MTVGGERRPHQPACLSNPVHETKREEAEKRAHVSLTTRMVNLWKGVCSWVTV
jgi:hypothetical protein